MAEYRLRPVDKIRAHSHERTRRREILCRSRVMAPTQLAKQTRKDARKNAAAAHQLALWHAAGEEGLSRDPELSFRWMLEAAERKCADAQCAIGEAYTYGAVGLQVDHAVAFVWTEKAALQDKAFPTYTSPFFISLT